MAQLVKIPSAMWEIWVLFLGLEDPLETGKATHSSILAWRAIPSPLSKLKSNMDSLEATQWVPRDPRRGSRGERSPLLPLEARPDSPGVTPFV